jgi:hypothetical protein
MKDRLKANWLYIAFLTLYNCSHYSATANDSLRLPRMAVSASKVHNAVVAGNTWQELKSVVEKDITNQTLDTTLGEKYKAQAIAAVQQLDQTNNYIDNLTPDDLNELPVGLRKTVNNITYKIAISNAVFHATHAELTVFAKVEIPQHPRTLFFGISGLKLSYKGGIVGDAKLVLLGNIDIPVMGGNAVVSLKGGFDLKSGQAIDGLTYVKVDCNGFKELGIAADISFPRSLLIPCNTNGDTLVNTSQKVQASFATVISDWNDILVSVNLPRFQIRHVNDVVFTVTDATIDLSDSRNSGNIVFPTGYEAKYISYPSSYLWRGVYVRTVDVQLPKMFRRKGASQPVSFGAQNLIIDNNGVTGNLYGNDILPFNEGVASGWRFSVEDFNIELEASRLVGAGFKGNIGLPVAQNDSLRYEAVITADNKYWLTVAPKGIIDFDLWAAKVELDSNSYVKLLVDKGEFLPEANLYGRMTVAAKRKPEASKPLAEFKGVKFRGLHLKTKRPYLTVDYFGYEGEVKVGDFPVSLDSIVLVANDTRADLSFGVKLTLMDDKFKADTRLNMETSMVESGGIQKWNLQKVGLASLSINNAQIGGLTLNGQIDFIEDDPIYGDGIGGGIQAKFEHLGLDVKVRARFGKKGFRYWFVDGVAAYSDGLPVLGPLRVHGFGGGAYYRMSKTGFGTGNNAEDLMPAYRPDSVMGLGIKAGVLFNVVKRQVADGQVSFEVAFNRNGGIRYVGLFGYAKFVGALPGIAGDYMKQAAKLFTKIGQTEAEQLKGLADNAKAEALEKQDRVKQNAPQEAAKNSTAGETITTNGIAAYVGMHYDFSNKTFHANFDIYVNAARGLLQGVGANYRAGWSVMHFAPEEWYVHMGTPSDPIGLKFGLGKFSIKTQSYLMLGTKIPGSPPPPQQVADILGVELSQLDYMRDLNALGDGRGIGLGSHISVATGDITLLMLYANFEAGVGFDLMLKEYPGAYCEGSSEPIGINGWYANAQAYAYLQGELGVKVNLWFVKARVPIIQGGAAALMQAKLPNPTWFRGYLGVKFSVLGGLVKGSANFKVQLGDECKIINGGQENPLGIKVIADMTPKEAGEADVFSAPQVAFNFPVDRDIPLMDETGNKTFRVNLDRFVLKHNGKELAGKLEWTAGKDAVAFHSAEILPPKATIEAYAKVSFSEWKGGTWQTVYMDGKKAEEERSIRFTTGTAPDNIPLHNIEYAYPVVDQRNFYRAESNKGYVQLKRGQTYLFNVPGYKMELFLQKEKGASQMANYSYDSVNRRIQYDLPQLELGSRYSYQLVTRPLNATSNYTPATIAASSQADGLDVTVTNKQAQDIIRDNAVKVLLGYEFSTSAYASFAAKISALTNTGTILIKVASDVVSMQKGVSTYEPFDLAELTGTSHTSNKALVQPYALVDDAYFIEDIFPRNYKVYPVGGDIRVSHRDTATLGLYPVRSLPVSLSYLSQIEQGNYSNAQVTQRLPYIYDLARIYKADFIDLQNQVVNRFLGTSRQGQYEWLIMGYFPFIRQGLYQVKYQYILPDGKPGSSAVVSYHNEMR